MVVNACGLFYNCCRRLKQGFQLIVAAFYAVDVKQEWMKISELKSYVVLHMGSTKPADLALEIRANSRANGKQARAPWNCSVTEQPRVFFR